MEVGGACLGTWTPETSLDLFGTPFPSPDILFFSPHGLPPNLFLPVGGFIACLSFLIVGGLMETRSGKTE